MQNYSSLLRGGGSREAGVAWATPCFWILQNKKSRLFQNYESENIFIEYGARVCHCAKSPKVHGFQAFSHSFGPKDFTK